jgi:hypothetical protein
MKEEKILFRLDQALKEEFQLYFGNISKKLVKLMETELAKEKQSRFEHLVQGLKGNRYAETAIDVAITDIDYHKSRGLTEPDIDERITALLEEKFEVDRQVSEIFLQDIYRGLYKSDNELLLKHRSSIVKTVGRLVKGGK